MAGGDLGILADEGMLELFRMETEMHAGTLEKGLVDLEGNPSDTGVLESLMRAAHSIKGAARILGLDMAVRLAHAMEDLFLAFQARQRILNPEMGDLLFKGVDVFKRLSRVQPPEILSWIRENEPAVLEMEEGIRALLSGPPPDSDLPPGEENSPGPLLFTAPDPTPATVSAPSPEPEPARIEAQTGPPAAGGSVPAHGGPEDAVPVSAESLSRMIGLTGECLIESQVLRSRMQELQQLKSLLIRLTKTAERRRPSSLEGDSEARDRQVLAEIIKMAGECRDNLSRQIEFFDTYLLRWENLSGRLYHEALAMRMRPFRDGIHGFPRMVRDLARSLGKKIRLRTSGERTKVDRDVLMRLEAPLTHILRNACDHGIEQPAERRAAGKPEEGTIELKAAHRAGMLVVVVNDDGRGIDPERIRSVVAAKGMVPPEVVRSLSDAELMEFLFLPGFTTTDGITELSGRGVGLDVVKKMIHEVQGTIRVQSAPGVGTSFQLELPLTLSVIRALLVEISRELYAFPLTRIDAVRMVPQEEIRLIEDQQYFSLEGRNVGIVAASQPLGLIPIPVTDSELSVVLIGDRLNSYGIVVDRLLGEVDLVVRPLDPRLGKVPNLSAAAVSEDGAPVLILDVDDLVRSVDGLLTGGRIVKITRSEVAAPQTAVKRILVVDDSITVREVERRLLAARGYQVDVAVDGMDGWNAVRTGKYDLIVSDVDMPRLNGFELVRKIKSDPQLSRLPVIILSYKDREGDRVAGLEAGANYYLTKSSFYDETYVNAVADLIGLPG
ncbi:MAG TPA: hybrid sensor histidine kinase/response regulator [Syntrophobacteraceae bacterium]|nr:hybrid sensor histidine kinase/response regulator [Syntrophobacteraceae bacterium]